MVPNPEIVFSICFLNPGTVTDGEFNSLCTRGRGSRPLHLYQLIQDIRKQVNVMREKRLKEILKENKGTVYHL